MKKNSIAIIVLVASMLVNIVTVHAADPEKVEFLNEDTEIALEIIIAALAIIGALLALKSANAVKGTDLEKGMRLLIYSAFTFAVLEIYQVIKIYIISISGLGDILELIFVVFFIFGFYKIGKTLR
ncbi:MAG: hypothetical protein ACW99A_14535 [Candidatus Kariarchaeaceae archaeon]|jgi:uncharacterized integral membrane protein